MSQPLDISSADEGKGVFSEKQIESTDGKMVENEVVFATQHGQALTKSRFDELSIPRTLWLFRRSIFFCLCVYTGYVCEGMSQEAGGERGFLGPCPVTRREDSWLMMTRFRARCGRQCGCQCRVYQTIRHRCRPEGCQGLEYDMV